MTYLDTPEDSPLFLADAVTLGYIANLTRVFALAPEVYAGWRHLSQAIQDGMDPRRYELATLAAARALDSEYCELAHAQVLRTRFPDHAALAAIGADHHTAGLDPVDVSIMDFAARVAADPAAADPAELRAHRLSDVEILQIVLAAGARRFFSGVLSAVRAEPDAALRAGVRVR